MSSTVLPSKALVKRDDPKSSRAAYVATQAASVAGWHAAQTPKLLLRVAGYAARGTFYSLPALVSFVWSGERREVARNAIRATPTAAKRAQDAWMYSVALRLALVTVPPLVIVTQVQERVGTPGLYALAAAVVLALAILGSRLCGETLTDKAPPRRGDITQERLDGALRSIGILNKPRANAETLGTSVEIRRLPWKANGGTGVVFDLPAGAKSTVHEVMANKHHLAAQLGVLDRMVVVKPTDDSEAQVHLWVADEDPMKAGTVESPYVEARRANIWDGVRIGTDPMGQPIVLQLLRNSVGLGGLPQVGKSTVARTIGAAVALDPYTDVVILDGKGGTDWSPAKPLASRYINGTSTRAIADMLGTTNDLVRKMDSTYVTLERGGLALAPDGRITPELAESHGIRPCVLIVDELQDILAELGNKAGDFAEALVRLSRRGPAAGIIVITISHRPDASSVPKALTGATPIKIACRTEDRLSSDLVLGEGANKAGWNASTLPPIEGVGIVRTQTFTTLAKFDYISLQQFQEICHRGMQLRAAAGTLREEADRDTDNLLDEVIEILSATSPLTPTALASRLAQPISPEAMGKRLSPFGLKSRGGAERLYYLEDALKAFG